MASKSAVRSLDHDWMEMSAGALTNYVEPQFLDGKVTGLTATTSVRFVQRSACVCVGVPVPHLFVEF